ncbi:hypothetical protein [Flavobacterium sp.]|uniref:hypothetical protein n=1 Tax=Flavobacterium sp. TaxID=239 RepID=UPI0037A30E46
MFKKSVFLIVLFSGFVSFAQEIVNSFPIDFKNNRDVFQIVNETTKKVTFFASDRKEVRAFLLNDKMQITDSVKSIRPEKKYADIAGYNGDKSSPRLFWISENHKDIFSQNFDFVTKNSANHEYKLKLQNEKFVQYFSLNELFYIMTVVKDSNILKFYVFDSEGKMVEKSIDTPSLFFLNNENLKTNLFGMLKEEIGLQSSYSVQKISPESTTSLVFSSKKRKCYILDNKVIMTFDSHWDYTQMLTIDLNSFIVSEKFIKKPFVSFQEKYDIDSNSYLFEGKLYQIKLSSSEFKLSVKSLDDVLLKEFAISNDDPIDFKNSVILQKGNAFTNGDRVLEKTSQFLRKVKNNNCAISCYNLNQNLLITLGGVSEIRGGAGGGMMMGGMGFGMAGALMMPGNIMFVPVYMNPILDNFNSYRGRKVIYINCLFNKEIDHLQGEIKPLAFDKIQDFLTEESKNNLTLFSNPNNQVDSETVFKIDSVYYLGYYDKNTKQYTIRKFED